MKTKEEQREYRRQYYRKNRITIMQKQMRSNEKHIEKRKLRRRAYYQENKDLLNEKQRLYVSDPERREAKRLYAQNWRAEHPEYFREHRLKKRMLAVQQTERQKAAA